MKNFRTYQLAVQFNREAVTLKLPGYLKDQFRRAAVYGSRHIYRGYPPKNSDEELKNL